MKSHVKYQQDALWSSNASISKEDWERIFGKYKPGGGGSGCGGEKHYPVKLRRVSTATHGDNLNEI